MNIGSPQMIARIWCGEHLLGLVFVYPSAWSHVLKPTATSPCVTSAFIVPWKIGLAGYRKRNARGCVMSSNVDSSGATTNSGIRLIVFRPGWRSESLSIMHWRHIPIILCRLRFRQYHTNWSREWKFYEIEINPGKFSRRTKEGNFLKRWCDYKAEYEPSYGRNQSPSECGSVSSWTVVAWQLSFHCCN